MQWPTTIAILLSGGDLAWLSWLARKGEERLKSKDRRIIQEGKELGGLRLEWFKAEG